jgi:S1-C subfamily serine protease
LIARTAVLLLLLNFCAASAGERGEIGMRLQQQGLAWRVVEITPNGAADNAGLQTGAVVIQINNLFLPSAEQLQRMVAGLKPGEVVKVSIIGPDGPVDHFLKAEPDGGGTR